MADTPYLYKAFISYRHVERDRKWAKWLLNKLEAYRTPKHLTEQGIASKVGKIFRDDDEIPASSNLGTQLEDALRASEFLIVICSPDTPASQWVCREIAFFKALGRGDNIIPLLVEGEPEVSFPQELLSISRQRINEAGVEESYEEAVEPLAADVRLRADEAHKETQQRALIRITAALLHCQYDALKNRERLRQQQRRRLLYSLTACLFIVLSGLTLFSWQQSNIAQRNEQQARQERDSARLSQSAFLMALAAEENQLGHHDTALLLGLNALPGLYGGERPEPQVLEPLTSALRLNRKRASFDHYSSISRIDYHAQSNILATTSGDNAFSASLWDTQTGKKLLNLQHESFVYSAVISPDGQTIVTTSSDNTAVLWDRNTGDKLHTFYFKGLVIKAIFNEDGSQLAIAAYDNTAQLWDLNSLSLLATFEHQKAIKDIVFSPDNRALATSSLDKTATVWDIETASARFSVEHQRTIDQLAISPDGRYLATASDDHRASVWSMADGKKIATGTHKKSVNSVAFSPDSRFLVTTSNDQQAIVWDLEKRQQRWGLSHQGSIKKAIFSQSGRFVATASFDNTAALWSMETGQRLLTLQHRGPVNTIQFIDDDTALLTASNDRNANLWDISDSSANQRLVAAGPTQLATFSPDGKQLATAAGSPILKTNSATIWDSQTREQQFLLTHKRTIVDVKFNSPGNLIATASLDGTAKLWDAQQGQPLHTFKHEHQVITTAFSHNNQWLATGSYDRSARVWDIKTGAQQHRFDLPDSVNQLIFHPNNRFLIVVSGSIVDRFAKDNQLSIWDLQSGERHQVLQHPNKAYIRSVSLSPDGRYLLTTSADHSAMLWDIETGANLQAFKHQGMIIKALFHPLKPHIITASTDKRISVWQRETGVKMATFNHQGSVFDIALSANGRYLASASFDKTAAIWDLQEESLIYQWRYGKKANQVMFDPTSDNRLAIAAADSAMIENVQFRSELLTEAAINKLPLNRRCLSVEERQRYFLTPLDDSQRRERQCQ